jgi:hypothetical protein
MESYLMSSPEYVRVPCAECQASVRVETIHLGEWVTCPKCLCDFLAQEPSAPPKPKPPAPREDRDKQPRRDRNEDDDRDRRRERDREDDREGRRARSRRGDRDDEDEDDYDDGPSGPRPGTCPNCRSRRSRKVWSTWWGGFFGPIVFGIVRCRQCGKQYNGKTGVPIGAKHIVTYYAVTLGTIFLLILVSCGCLALLGKK